MDSWKGRLNSFIALGPVPIGRDGKFGSMDRFHLNCIVICFACIVTLHLHGCTASSSPEHGGHSKTWHEQNEWKAQDFFKDKDVVALCQAIEVNDLERMKRLIADGVNLNAKGKGNMTPLLWSYFDAKLPRFELLLKNGADPNVTLVDRFGTNELHPGDSVMTLCASNDAEGFLEAVLQHGGDPSMTCGQLGQTTLHLVVNQGKNKRQRIKLLLEHGVDIDQYSDSGDTALMEAAAWGGQYDIALFLLKHGADPCLRDKYLQNFVNQLVVDEAARQMTAKQQEDFAELTAWLEEKGWDLAAARRDYVRWKKWNQTHEAKWNETLGYRERAVQGKAERDQRVLPCQTVIE